MKIVVLAVLVLGAGGVPLLGQDSNEPVRRRTPFGGDGPGYGWGSGGSGYGSGTGYNGGSGYGGGWWSGGSGSGYLFGYPGWGSIWGGRGGYYGYGYGGYSGYGFGGYYPGAWGGEGGFGRPHFGTAVAGPLSGSAPAVDPQGMAFRGIEEGRRRFRVGDYRGAVEAFRSAVVATTDSPVAQAWFAVSLIAQGEGRNADKALRSAVASGLPPASLSLDGLFRDDKEKVRMIVAMAKVGAEGGLSAAYLLSLAGEPVRLKQLAEKDSAARLLLPKP